MSLRAKRSNLLVPFYIKTLTPQPSFIPSRDSGSLVQTFVLRSPHFTPSTPVKIRSPTGSSADSPANRFGAPQNEDAALWSSR